jgi:hypothetical protein
LVCLPHTSRPYIRDDPVADLTIEGRYGLLRVRTVESPRRWRVASAHDPVIGGFMERFINTEAIKNYCKQLNEPGIEKDPVRREMLVRLLTEELAKDAKPK